MYGEWTEKAVAQALSEQGLRQMNSEEQRVECKDRKW